MTLISGSVSHGQGHETVFKQLVCDRLGIDPKDVHYEQGDTDIVFYGEGTGGSRTSAIGGGAMLMAADKILVRRNASRPMPCKARRRMSIMRKACSRHARPRAASR